ncbi:EF-hand calcium-binding domain-containing protein 14 isoform X2 [Sus scrofa]|uniref:EF-hand calcium-binding domain-containing protein 14 isoform X2 n=1 Tax=Sus scrofa TaxID=9823 RepID=UPI0006B1B134|nr:EF-hand calcium-binding domain-containing protein 14 isoform X2 [Sus scrofa]
MKKRKELNALIGLAGDSRRKKPKKGSGHRLLRTEPPDSDSESSSEEEEEFGVAGNRSRFVKGDYLRCCKICYPLCAFVILAACVMACVGLVWMQVALKEDLDALKEKFRTMESNQKSSFQEIPKLNEELLSKQKRLEKIESGELGLNKVWINITEMNKQISLLTSAVNHLKANVKSAADLISLPATVEGLQKSVASIGNTLNSVHLAVEAIQKTVDEHKKTMELLQSDVVRKSTNAAGSSTPASPFLCDRGIPTVRLSKQTPPCTFLKDPKEHILKDTSGSNQIIPSPSATSEPDNGTHSENLKQLDDRAATLKRESLYQVTNRTESVKSQSIKKEASSDSQVSKLREKLQLINALTNKPESSRPPETANEEQVQSFTSEPSTSPKRPRSLGGQIEKAAQLRPISIPGISSIKDLEDLFHKTGQDMDGKLTYQEIWNSLGSAVPEPERLRAFDFDGDGGYSLSELRVALGF